MGISEEKMKIVIDNYFKTECNIDTSIREAFEKGFRIGVKKVASAQPKGRWEAEEDYDGDTIWRCSECGTLFVLIDGTPMDNDYHYCPHCGCEMVRCEEDDT